ncbi:glycosyltransferase family 2 protein [Psychroserpens sp. Hel_I_66]|uniref:glycosyltransferase family 2 protein n=1 Tax=Psychroserpens sp. Hel_I_66 TaxID=1250004 RepID=UPI0009DFA46C|nr:glycosyltransferase family 2 protein [Psychroserpens sp. Hel_I_66]
MKSNPLVSVLMTAYNRENFIASAIESVMASTYQEWELIILDDGSKDRTVEICKSYETKDERVKVFVNEKNLGQFKNRNKIVDYANGEYIKYLDSDDLIYPYGLEQLVYYMEQFPEAGYGLCSIEQDNEQLFPIMLSPEETYKRHFVEKKAVFHKAPLSSIIKTKVFRDLGGFPHEAVSGDLAMWCELSLSNNVILMPHGMVWYRVHADQEMQKTRDSVFVEFEYFKVEDYYLSLTECPLSKGGREKVIKLNQTKQKKYIFWKLRQLGPSIALKLYKYMNKPFELNRA